MNRVDSVVMNAATRSWVMKKALTMPKASPSTAMTGKATIGGSHCMKTPRSTALTYMLAPTERSMPGDQEHEGHADRDDRDVRRLGEDVEEVDGRQEAARQQAEDDDQKREQKQRRVLERDEGEPVAIAHQGVPVVGVVMPLALALPSHIAGPQDDLAVEAVPARSCRGSRRGPSPGCGRTCRSAPRSPRRSSGCRRRPRRAC